MPALGACDVFLRVLFHSPLRVSDVYTFGKIFFLSSALNDYLDRKKAHHILDILYFEVNLAIIYHFLGACSKDESKYNLFLTDHPNNIWRNVEVMKPTELTL